MLTFFLIFNNIKKYKVDIFVLFQDLQSYLDNSENGVVYFSLGSTVLSSGLSNATLNEIITAFSQLPFNVLWKWEKEVHPSVTSNVYIQKYFPQQDLLGEIHNSLFLFELDKFRFVHIDVIGSLPKSNIICPHF